MDDLILQTSVVDMYAKCENLCYAKRVFDRMRKRNLASWNSIITAYFANGMFQNALELFRDLLFEGWQRPRSSMLALVLNICGVTTDLRKGKELHGYILKCSSREISEMEKLIEFNGLIDMYIKTGNMTSAILIFERMQKRNVVTWTIMISGYGTYGLSQKALDAFDEMRSLGIKPDGVTFISILSACSHSGLVDEGREIFLSMNRDYDTVPEMKHFVCMVDLYGRAGRVNEALDFISRMPIEPSKFVWGTLLSCCRNHKNLKLGEFAAKKALELDRYDVGNYIMLSRIYADAKRWDDVAKVRMVMKELGLKANTAYSWVEKKGKVYKFSVGDRLKEFSVKMYDILNKAGFEPDTSSIGHNLEHEEAKVSDLCGHTEKVALAFVLMGDGGEKLIRIGKNLRVCKDCHEAFKFASKAYGREIILKDPNLYHQFSQGCCSCNDFW
ncbi:pentatricopeptide repeat-containing protein At3g24000, mitochondrial-like isoform X2 [Asparagus officinalis]|nr:pentatricopeptide repeat-containing protein At3g24000, mitochondrial-like isoform X2 [Asparagus officinalis]